MPCMSFIVWIQNLLANKYKELVLGKNMGHNAIIHIQFKSNKETRRGNPVDIYFKVELKTVKEKEQLVVG